MTILFLTTGVTSFSTLSVVSECQRQRRQRQQQQQRSRIILVRSNKRHEQESIHSYVEGSPYQNDTDEIEAMGGDPFFLEDDENVFDSLSYEPNSWTSSSSQRLNPIEFADRIRYATDGKGPTPTRYKQKAVETYDWEWDGIPDDEAHLGLD
jgi:hypothetical protein